MSVKAWTCSSRVLQIIVFRAEQMYSSACTSRCDELGVGQNRVAARHRQVREASSSSFGVTAARAENAHQARRRANLCDKPRIDARVEWRAEDGEDRR